MNFSCTYIYTHTDQQSAPLRMERMHFEEQHPNLGKVKPLPMQVVHDLELATNVDLQDVNLPTQKE